MRGDRPGYKYSNNRCTLFTPHARGSTWDIWGDYSLQWVYPACAGIDLGGKDFCVIFSRLPRMRGDRPIFILVSSFCFLFTPHARGSTFPVVAPSISPIVYPACAGIDPRIIIGSASKKSLPRMRGDRPGNNRPRRERVLFTPHARGSTSRACYWP